MWRQMLFVTMTLVTMQTVQLLTCHAVLACTDHSLLKSTWVAVHQRLHCIACHQDD